MPKENTVDTFMPEKYHWISWFIIGLNVLTKFGSRGNLFQYGRSVLQMIREPIRNSVNQEPRTRNTKTLTSLKMFQMSLHYILKDNLHLYACKWQFVQKLQLTSIMLKLFSLISETGSWRYWICSLAKYVWQITFPFEWICQLHSYPG